jgi:1,4-alpha-glucan branching enzyme
VGEALDQAIRELLLLQSSDWPFIIKTGTATRYAEARVRAHVHRLRHLGHLVETGTVEGTDGVWLDELRSRDNFLASMTGEELRAPFDG